MNNYDNELRCDVMITNRLVEYQVYRKEWGWEFCKQNIAKTYDEARQRFGDVAVEELETKAFNTLAFIQSHPNPPVETALASVYESVRVLLRSMKNADSDNRDEIAGKIAELQKRFAKDFTNEAFANTCAKSLFRFGFGVWDGKEVDGKTLVLIPLWASLVLPADMQVTSIFGNKETLGSCDKDVRMGCLAFGLYIKA